MSDTDTIETVVLPATDVPERPAREAHVRAALGDWGVTSICGGGLVVLPAPVLNGRDRVSVHTRLVPVFDRFFKAIYEAGLWDQIHDVMGFKARTRKFASTSLGIRRHHLSSWGAAVSLNADRNGEGHQRKAPMEDPFQFHPTHPIVKIAEECGLVWAGCAVFPSGKRNRYPDPSTFQYVTEW